MLDLSTYLLRSGARQGGQIKRAIPFAVHEHEEADFLHDEHLGTPLIPSSVAVNPSKDLPPKYLPRLKPTPRTSTAIAKSICGVNLNGITEVISSSISGKH
jgi:hypothetical protein